MAKKRIVMKAGDHVMHCMHVRPEMRGLHLNVWIVELTREWFNNSVPRDFGVEGTELRKAKWKISCRQCLVEPGPHKMFQLKRDVPAELGTWFTPKLITHQP